VRPVRLLAKLPVPVPPARVLSAVVGLGEVLQHTPRAVTGSPPLAVTLPPLEAVKPVTSVTAVVVTVGATAVVRVTSIP
jgi:hypothetical protein